MADKSSQPIVVKKIVQGGGHHGGSWKVAYADFVTAMMAFFLLMWLMGSTTKEQKAAISEYFNNPSPEEGISLKPSPNAIQGPGGSSTSLIDQGGIGVLSAEEKTVSDSAESPPDEDKKEVRDEQSAKEAAEKTFRERVEQMLEELKELTEKSETLRQYADQLLFDLTSEGLRIQIIDRENRPMFDVGSAALKPHTIEILREITKVINEINSPGEHQRPHRRAPAGPRRLQQLGAVDRAGERGAARAGGERHRGRQGGPRRRAGVFAALQCRGPDGPDQPARQHHGALARQRQPQRGGAGGRRHGVNTAPRRCAGSCGAAARERERLPKAQALRVDSRGPCDGCRSPARPGGLSAPGAATPPAAAGR